MSMSMQRFIVIIIAIIAIAYFGPALLNQGDDTPEAAPTSTVAAPAPTTEPAPAEAPAPEAPQVDSIYAAALEALDTVGATATEATGYERDLFGSGWKDPDRNGCDARNDILARDLVDVVKEGSCKVLSGYIAADPYAGNAIDFVRGQDTSRAIQIDHIIPLSWAFKNGANSWDEQTRVAFANDPENLLAVDGPANSSKSDSGPSEWMPSDAGNPAFDCDYAVAFVDVLTGYDLTAPSSDINALRETLTTCS